MKLIKVRFTAWREKSVSSRPSAIQQQLDAWRTRRIALTTAAARVKADRSPGESLKNLLGRIAAELRNINADRKFLLSAEKAAAEAEAHAASKHARAGTVGYLIMDGVGVSAAMVVDEAGDYLPEEAAYSFEVVDDNPPLPEWAKRGKVGRFA